MKSVPSSKSLPRQIVITPSIETVHARAMKLEQSDDPADKAAAERCREYLDDLVRLQEFVREVA